MRKTPDSMKIHRGTDEPRFMSGDVMRLPLSECERDAPDWFSVRQLAEWNRLVPVLQNVKVLSDGDWSLLELACGLYGEIVEEWASGHPPTASMMAQVGVLYGKFGLSPVDRMKITVSDDGEETNKFKKRARKSLGS